jgi:hypothetical protein
MQAVKAQEQVFKGRGEKQRPGLRDNIKTAKKKQATERKAQGTLQVEENQYAGRGSAQEAPREKVEHDAEKEAGKDAGCEVSDQKGRVPARQEQAAGCVTP